MLEKISSMAIVFAKNRNNCKVLLLNNEGEWVFPKGHVEDGETYIMTAIRELYEESGVVVQQKDCLGQVDEFSFYFDGEKAIKIIKVFLFVIEKTQSIKYNKAEGFIDAGWYDINHAISILKHDDAKNSLTKAVEKVL
ncbi:MAG: NUDIX domain-containing protein [Clostridia bacterium]|nr:NUDIX domain-containing protein [Clostridia bacterium]